MGVFCFTLDKAKPETELKFVFVHGLSGWGSYDLVDQVFPYWGLSGGNVISYLNHQGYHSYAAFDMHIDNAYALNEWISTFDNVYYFSYPCASYLEGTTDTDASITESMFMKSAILMSQYTGSTAGGIEIDESWKSNDGLVNEISAKASMNAPSLDYEEGMDVKTGVWYVMPTLKGDHMYLQGGMTKRVKIKPFYFDLVIMISELYD